MVSLNANHSLLLLLIALCTLIPHAAAQLGTKILSPKSNSTVHAGEKVEIVFEYNNMGSGAYNIDIDLYRDGGMRDFITNVVKDYDVPDGNSTGVQLPLTLNSTYLWEVPHGLNVTPEGVFYLAATASISTPYFDYLRQRSSPLILHYSAGVLNSPASFLMIMTAILSALLMV